MSTEESYKKLILSDDPVSALATAFEVDASKVEATRGSQNDYLEWTFLARIISLYAKRARWPALCVQYTLECIEDMVGATYMRHFPKVRVIGNGATSTTISGFKVSLEELRLLFEFVKMHTSTSSDADPSSCVRAVLTAWEVIWGFPIPEDVNKWLQVNTRERMESILDV